MGALGLTRSVFDTVPVVTGSACTKSVRRDSHAVMQSQGGERNRAARGICTHKLVAVWGFIRVYGSASAA